MKSTRVTPIVDKNPEPIVDIDLIIKRLEDLEGRCTQLATAMKDTVTFETLAARLIGISDTTKGTKKVRKPRAKREWSPEEKAAFHAKMLAGRLAKQQAREAAAKK